MMVTLGNLYYYPLKVYVFIASILYFRKLSVTGRENIPTKGPLIFAINHQNALLDALLLSVISWRNPHFLTRADVFNNKYVDKFLRGLKMLPIYRIRDGFNSIRRNEVIFETAKKILTNGGVVGIFPEGSHSLLYKVRPLKKGVARIAFMTEEASNFDLNLQIVPIGVQYESHFLPKGRTLISFGKPIKVADYRDKFNKDQNDAYESILDELSRKLKTLVLNIDVIDDYDRVLTIYKEKRGYKRNLKEQLIADQDLIDAIIEGKNFEVKPDKKNIILSPLAFIWSVLWKIIGFIPKTITDLFVQKTTKDPHFYGTMRFTYSIFLYPIIYLVLYFLIRYLVF